LTDVTRRGRRGYSLAEKRRVLASARSLGKDGAWFHQDAICAATQLEGRTVRQILIDAEKESLLKLDLGNRGYRLVESYSDAQAGSRRLLATANALLKRVARHRADPGFYLWVQLDFDWIIQR
jgi:hypothetical protein